MSTDIKSLAIMVLRRHGVVAAQSQPHQSGETGTRLVETAPALCPQSPQWWEPGAVCWHCSGAGRCGCVVCDVGVALDLQPGLCAICCGSGHVPARVQ